MNVNNPYAITSVYGRLMSERCLIIKNFYFYFYFLNKYELFQGHLAGKNSIFCRSLNSLYLDLYLIEILTKLQLFSQKEMHLVLMHQDLPLA